jgi:hypothetical protein
VDCRHCGKDTRCINSRRYPSPREQDIPKNLRDTLPEGARWRRYKCLICDSTTETIELLAPE